MNAGKVDFTGVKPSIIIDVYTGLAGLRLIDTAIKNNAIKSGLVINASDICRVSKTDFIEYTIPFLSSVRFHIDPDKDKAEGEYINGYRIGSYSFTIKTQGEESIDIVATGQKEKRLIVLEAKKRIT